MKARLYRNYLLFVLSAILALNYADRMSLGLVLQGIKIDLHLSDTQLGILTGIASAFFQSIVGIPIASWVDRGNRISVISFTVVVWSVMVAFTGRATTFTQLLLARFGVGVGEVGISPAAQSLIPDYFTRAERPRATAIYSLAWPMSVALGYFVAGWINELYGRRAMFLALGLTGLLLTLMARLWLREPRHGLAATLDRTIVNAAGVESGFNLEVIHPNYPRLKEVLRTLWQNVTFRHLLVCNAVTSLFAMGIAQWLPTFFVRTYGMTTAQIGTWFTVAIGLCSVLPIYSGGALTSRYAANNERLQFRIMAAAYVAIGVDYAMLFLSTNRYLAIALLALNSLAFAMNGPILAAFQTLIPPRMRAMSIVTVTLFTNLVGLGLGPLIAGALSDALRRVVGGESLRFALLGLCPGYAWGAWHMWRASRTVGQDLAKLNAPGRAGRCVHFS